MYVVRPARTADLPAIEKMAVASGIGVTSLPNNREKLFERIQQSLDAFEHDADLDAGKEYYMFVLEAHGQVVGTASISACAGFDEPFYSYRSETFVHASRTLKVNNKVHVLTMCHDLTGLVQLCGFYSEPAIDALAIELLSRARFLFIASQQQRFGRRVVAEMQGIHDAAGQSPFWDAIGRRFFDMDFVEVEQAFASRSKTFIAELMPAYPIYVPLMPGAAQQAIGQIHPDFERPFGILGREGFEADNYIDIFDGGAVLTADVDRLYTVRTSSCHPVEVTASLPASANLRLASNEKVADFAATLVQAEVVDGVAFVNPDGALALGVASGDTIRLAPLQVGPEGEPA
ncbi:arginine/ornithine succinyltransferase subunit alpha [Crenobacter cavernae]|uniref:Arginine/ornithine succinyltransferase subunit alpha n=1 Tax=Crenobacter cavernae TaxID=2290923 RepID=A0ABY0FAD3_9NEIS|nr:arginine/ornithine succinyltransferase subunit alpha [Crenobacter cavernae]RXZ42546.1 arginine/ornithine succinyltransferase subunit alpha [Crenobacter cavernae]